MKTNYAQSKFDEIVAKLIEDMENGMAPWMKPWGACGMPANLSTGKNYKGVNILLLSFGGFSTNLWGTFNQIKALHGMVKKGEKSMPVFFFDMIEKKEEDEETGEEKTRKIPMLRCYNVFNADQVEWSEKTPARITDALVMDRNPGDRIDDVEAFVETTGANIINGGNRAYWNPQTDEIGMPKFEAFRSPDDYYAVLLHELTHWTGSESRLDRKRHEKYGDKTYAFEELIAEIGSAFLCGHFALNVAPAQHPEYLKSWAKKLTGMNTRDAAKFIWKAAADAQKAFDFLMQCGEEMEGGEAA